MKKIIKAIIFDLDGVIVDSEPIIEASLLKFADVKGIPLSPEFIKKNIGGTRESFWKSYSDFHMRAIDINLYTRESALLTMEMLNEQTLTLDYGIYKLLDEIKSLKLKSAIATSSSRERLTKVLQLANLTNRFDVLTCGDDIKKSKPSPEIFLTTLKRLKVHSNACIVIEDSKKGIEASKNAKIFTIELNRTLPQSLHGNNITIHSLSDLNLTKLLSSL